MKLKDFCDRYPNLNRQQIADVAGCSVHLVHRWFSADANQPTSDHELRFRLAHTCWTLMDEQNEFFEILLRIRGELHDR
jgi:AraC-like DNA-binding protein